MKSLVILFFCFYVNVLWSQYYNPKYVQDLRFRLYLGYFQENRSLSVDLDPSKINDTLSKESIKLNTISDVYSGLQFSYGNTTILAGSSLPQTTESVQKFGKQNAKYINVTSNFKSFFLSFLSKRQNGFYDANFAGHPNDLNDSLAYIKFNNTSFRIYDLTLSSLRNHKDFAFGLPYNLGLRQKKTKFSIASFLGLSYVDLNQKGEGFFRKILRENSQELNFSRIETFKTRFGLQPCMHLVISKKLFFYADVPITASLQFNKKHLIGAKTQQETKVNFDASGAKIAIGYHGPRFIFMMYSAFNQSIMYQSKLTAKYSSFSFGINLGFRINLYKNLPWEK